MKTFFGLRTQVLTMWRELGVLSSPTGGAFAPPCICHGQTGGGVAKTSQGGWNAPAWRVPGGSANSASVVFGRWWRKEGPPSGWKAVDVDVAWPNNRACSGFGLPGECGSAREVLFNRGCCGSGSRVAKYRCQNSSVDEAKTQLKADDEELVSIVSTHRHMNTAAGRFRSRSVAFDAVVTVQMQHSLHYDDGMCVSGAHQSVGSCKRAANRRSG